MKKLTLLYIILSAYIFSACEDEIRMELDSTESFLAVDAFLTNVPDTQRIILTLTQPYFSESVPAAIGAVVRVRDSSNGEVYDFQYNSTSGAYEWLPSSTQAHLGEVGNNFTLEIKYEGVTYTATSTMHQVPSLDSITFEYTKSAFFSEDYYVGEFWARDFEGVGDTYWIKTWKNGQYLNKPSEILISYDAGGGVGADVDNVIFIPPIRFGINPGDEDEDGSLLPPYLEGDSVYVELHSITNESYFFLSRVANETNRPGGFGELFSDPLGSIPTNLTPSDENVRVAGFFNVAAVSGLGVLVDEGSIRDKLPD